MNRKYFSIIVFLFSALFLNQEDVQKFKPLFNGKDISGWYSFLKTKGKSNDQDTVFSVNNGLLKITGKEFGYIVTEKTFTDFHLVVEFKWGEKKYPPRENRVRDNGICYYVVPTDKVWPRSVECQIQEGDCGDFWLIDSVTAVVDGVLEKECINDLVSLSNGLMTRIGNGDASTSNGSFFTFISLFSTSTFFTPLPLLLLLLTGEAAAVVEDDLGNLDLAAAFLLAAITEVDLVIREYRAAFFLLISRAFVNKRLILVT